jgi:hypothetical protein
MGASQSQSQSQSQPKISKASKASCSRRYSSHAEIETLFKTEIKSIIQNELSINSENPIDAVSNICAKLSAPEFKDAIMKKCSFSTTSVFIQEKPIEQLAQINKSKTEDNVEHSNQVEEPEPHAKQVHQEQIIQLETSVQPKQAEPHQEQTIQLESSIQPEQAEPFVQLEQVDEHTEPLLQLDQMEQHESLSKPVPQEQEQTEPLVQFKQPEHSVQQETSIQPEQVDKLKSIAQSEPLIQLEEPKQHELLNQ